MLNIVNEGNDIKYFDDTEHFMEVLRECDLEVVATIQHTSRDYDHTTELEQYWWNKCGILIKTITSTKSTAPLWSLAWFNYRVTNNLMDFNLEQYCHQIKYVRGISAASMSVTRLKTNLLMLLQYGEFVAPWQVPQSIECSTYAERDHKKDLPYKSLKKLTELPIHVLEVLNGKALV